jgi:hypothetical protein
VGAWLVCTLAWLPLVIPTLAYSLGTIQVEGSSRLSLFFVWILFMVGWFATGLLNMRGSQLAALIAFVLATVVTVLIFILVGGIDGVVLAPSAATQVATSLALGVAFGVGFAIAGVRPGQWPES